MTARPAGALARHNPDEQESGEINLEEEDVDIAEEGLMERPSDGPTTSTTKLGESVEEDMETKTTEGSKTREEATQTGEEKVGQGEGEDSGEEGGVTGEGEDRRGGTAGKGGDDKEVDEIKANRPSTIAAYKSCWQEVGKLPVVPQKEGDKGTDPAATLYTPVSTSYPSSPYICDPCRLLQRRVHGGSERHGVGNRARPQDESQQSQQDPEILRGLSLK